MTEQGTGGQEHKNLPQTPPPLPGTPAIPPPPGQQFPGFPPPPATPSTGADAGPTTGRRRLIIVGVVFLLVVVAIGWAVTRGGTASQPAKPQVPISMPQTLAGYPRMHSGSMDDASAKAAAAGKDHNVQIQLGYFGEGAATAFYVKAADRYQFTGTSIDYLRTAATGFTAAGTSSVDLEQATQTMEGSLPVACAPIVGDAPGTLCAWADPETWGVVRTYSGQTVPSNLVLTAHDATVGANH